MRPYPPGFVDHNDKMVIPEPTEEFLNGDQLCAGHFRGWWDNVKVETEKQFQRYMRLNKRPVSQKRQYKKFDLGVFANPYTQYPSPDKPDIDVPVEAILGETFGPMPDAKWRRDYFGCWITCQDIRKTLEWVLNAKQQNTKSMRARYIFGMLCPKGMVSRQTFRVSWREYETEQEIADAFAILATLGDKFQLEKYNEFELIAKGHTGVITGCECYVPTADELADALFLADVVRYNGHSIYAERGTLIRRLKGPNEETVRTRNESSRKRARTSEQPNDKASSSSDPTTGPSEVQDGETTIVPEDSILPEEEVFEEIRMEDLDLEVGEVECHDYNYPTLNAVTANAVLTDTTNEPPPEVNTIQATLLNFAGFTSWSWDDLDFEPGPSSGSGKPGHKS